MQAPAASIPEFDGERRGAVAAGSRRSSLNGRREQVRGRGLTLIELLAACVILALAATLSIGAARELRGSQDRLAAAHAVESALRRARSVAASDVWGGRDVEVAFGERIEIRLRADALTDRSEDRSRTLDAIRVEVPKGWTAALIEHGGLPADGSGGGGGGATLSFTPGGACVDATVLCRSQRGDVAVVEVLGISGQTTTSFGEDAIEHLRKRGAAP